MKRSTITLVGSLLVMSLFFIGCGAAGAGASCSQATNICSTGNIQACCTSVKCWYKYDGKKYNCNGLDCSSAAVAVVEDACPSSLANGALEELQAIAKGAAEGGSEL